MKRAFTLVLEALALVAVALISAFISMRVAIHGREAVVPTLTGLAVADATDLARRDGLRLTLENRFYSAGVPPGRILAQDPAPGSRVRREWPIRITESLGSQAVNIPDLTGESERAATVSIRRLSLDLGTVAHLAVPGDPGIVLAQTPPANSGGVDGPRVSLLISDPQDSLPPPAYVMPSLLGLTWSAAVVRASMAGLHLIPDAAPAAAPATAQTSAPAAPPPTAQTAPAAAPVAGPSVRTPSQAAIQSSLNKVQSDLLAISPTPPPTSPAPGGVILTQYPQPGRRVVQGDAVHVTLGQPTQTAAPPASQ
ncbi:MAG: PASTA domain-containing protein [Acidobacteriaceae bacterium]|jgi:beta-lactam-binding protein with PASTA domain